jgi:G3E family GTPase
MIGGFLGAGKTTSVSRLAAWLADQGRRAGLIVNDQGSHLVDRQVLAERGFPVQEIPGGCFCCRFDALLEVVRRMTEETQPEVFLTEPVGSCADLAATVTYPLRELHREGFSIGPLSVLVDPIRALRVFSLLDGDSFSEEIAYIYLKQLEEADVIVINKSDLVETAALEALRQRLTREFPEARLFEVSALHGQGLKEWFEHILASDQVPRAVMEMDYDIYAEGEAQLGWLNGSLDIHSEQPFDGNQCLIELATELQRRLAEADAEVAHLKMTLSDHGREGLSEVHLVRSDGPVESAQSLTGQIRAGELLVNLRAELDPGILRESVLEAVAVCLGTEPAISYEWKHLEAFKPGRPQPTHRITTT